MLFQLKCFLHDDAAAVSIEYALIAIIVSISIVAGCQAIAVQLSAIFNNVAGVFSAALPAK